VNDATGSGQSTPPKLKLSDSFLPCPVDTGDEIFCTGIFEFNITRLTAYIESNAALFGLEPVAVASIPNYGGSRLYQATIAAADLTRPVLFAECVFRTILTADSV
jgi:hypothetical protein